MPQSGSTTPKTKRQGVLLNGRKRWDKEGEDAVHLTRKILANSELRFKDFINEHKDWLERYKREMLYKHFNNQRKKVESYKEKTDREFFIDNFLFRCHLS